jgi:hypothetical protein
MMYRYVVVWRTRFKQLLPCLGMTSCLIMATASAQDFYQGYRFAPKDGNGPTGGFLPDSTWADGPTTPTGPYGHSYRFRDDPKMPRRDAGMPKFRPDPQLGQQPKNWSGDSSWASDPVLRQGMVFRPLGDARETSKSPAREVAPVPAMPGTAIYGDPWGGGFTGYYPPAVPGDPALGGYAWPGVVPRIAP